MQVALLTVDGQWTEDVRLDIHMMKHNCVSYSSLGIFVLLKMHLSDAELIKIP